MDSNQKQPEPIATLNHQHTSGDVGLNEFIEKYREKHYISDSFILSDSELKAILQEYGEALLAKAYGESLKQQWQDISTAPKDGTQILLCKRTKDGKPLDIFAQCAAWWSDENGSGQGDWVVYCSLVTEPRLFFEPTHWMPLPAPPASEGGV